MHLVLLRSDSSQQQEPPRGSKRRTAKLSKVRRKLLPIFFRLLVFVCENLSFGGISNFWKLRLLLPLLCKSWRQQSLILVFILSSITCLHLHTNKRWRYCSYVHLTLMNDVSKQLVAKNDWMNVIMQFFAAQHI